MVYTVYMYTGTHTHTNTYKYIMYVHSSIHANMYVDMHAHIHSQFFFVIIFYYVIMFCFCFVSNDVSTFSNTTIDTNQKVPNNKTKEEETTNINVSSISNFIAFLILHVCVCMGVCVHGVWGGGGGAWAYGHRCGHAYSWMLVWACVPICVYGPRHGCVGMEVCRHGCTCTHVRTCINCILYIDWLCT